MKEIGAAKFKEQCWHCWINSMPGLIVTKHGKPARVIPYATRTPTS